MMLNVSMAMGSRDEWGQPVCVCMCVSYLILKIMLALVPTRSLFTASAPSSDIFNRHRVCGAEAAVSIKALHTAPFLVQKHSTFLLCCARCFNLENI